MRQFNYRSRSNSRTSSDLSPYARQLNSKERSGKSRNKSNHGTLPNITPLEKPTIADRRQEKFSIELSLRVHQTQDHNVILLQVPHSKIVLQKHRIQKHCVLHRRPGQHLKFFSI
jgi:hypothetical protein